MKEKELRWVLRESLKPGFIAAYCDLKTHATIIESKA